MTTSLNKVRLPDGTELNISEWLHWPLYSTIEFHPGDGINLLAFSYVRGQPVAHTQTINARNATDADTNLVRKGKTGMDEASVVYAITYEIFALTSESLTSPTTNAALLPTVFGPWLRELQRTTTVELLVGAGIKKAQVEVPFSYIPQSIGSPIWVSGTNNNAQMATGGVITPRNQRLLNLPVYIGGFGENAEPGNSMVFNLKYKAPNGPPGGANTDNVCTLQDYRIRWWLDGLKKRPA